MSRIVIVKFDDNDEAAKFADLFSENVIGMYAYPTMFCECPTTEADRARGGYKIARGSKLGWWIHRECGKPNKLNWQTPVNLLSPGDKARFTFAPRLD